MPVVAAFDVAPPSAAPAVPVAEPSYVVAAARHPASVQCQRPACVLLEILADRLVRKAFLGLGFGLDLVASLAFEPVALLACASSAVADASAVHIEGSLWEVSKRVLDLQVLQPRTLHLLHHLSLLIWVQMRHRLRSWVGRSSRTAWSYSLLHPHHRSRL